MKVWIIFRQESPEADPEVILEYQLDGLRPATTYALRIAAVNDIGDSDYSESVIVQTLEEGTILLSFIRLRNKFNQRPFSFRPRYAFLAELRIFNFKRDFITNFL